MKFLSCLAAMAAVFTASLTQSTVDAHGWLMEPKSRDTGPGTDVEGKMGCPNNNPGQTTDVKPGDKLKVRYPRNNHIGGFIRWAIVPRGQESKENFDKNVFFYTCRESGGCLPPGKNDKYMGDNGAAANSVMCGDTITLPDWLKAGSYVLQWTWMSAGSSYGNLEWANEQYRSCADLKFSEDGKGSNSGCPGFQGGDRVTKLEGKGDDVCFYFQDNKMVTSVFKGEKGKADQYYKYGKPADVENCKAAPAPAPKPAPAPAPTPDKKVGNEGGAGGAPSPSATKKTNCIRRVRV